MKITAIKQQVRNENRASIFLDGKYAVSLTLDQLLAEKLKKDLDIDESRLKNLKKLSDEGKLKTRATEWLMGRPHSTREFRDYLYRKKAEKEQIEAWVEEFTSKSFLDDEAFARWFAEQRRRKNKSNRAITAELYSKGISARVISAVVANLDSESADDKSEKQALEALVTKLQNRPRYQDEQKLKTYLVGKGFSYSLVKEVLDSH